MIPLELGGIKNNTVHTIITLIVLKYFKED